MHPSGNRLTIEAQSLAGLISDAFGIEFDRIVLPEQLRNESVFYDVVAKAEGDRARTVGELRQMLQNLLAERFALKVHRETRAMAVYALVLDKGGPKFHESNGDDGAQGNFVVDGTMQKMAQVKCDMACLARSIRMSFVWDRPVVDRTGLKGTYDVKLQATPQYWMGKEPDADNVSIFTALREQLGLRLEPRKLPIEVLVVDSAEKPELN